MKERSHQLVRPASPERTIAGKTNVHGRGHESLAGDLSGSAANTEIELVGDPRAPLIEAMRPPTRTTRQHKVGEPPGVPAGCKIARPSAVDVAVGHQEPSLGRTTRRRLLNEVAGPGGASAGIHRAAAPVTIPSQTPAPSSTPALSATSAHRATSPPGGLSWM